MAYFEGEKNLNRETSELEVKGKFKLSEEELDNVAGGCGGPTRTKGKWSLCDGAHYIHRGSILAYNESDHACGNCYYFKGDSGYDWEGDGDCTYSE